MNCTAEIKAQIGIFGAAPASYRRRAKSFITVREKNTRSALRIVLNENLFKLELIE